MVHPLNAVVHHSQIGQTFSMTNLTPRNDVILLPDIIIWYIELPGVSKNEVKVQLQHYHLSVEGIFSVAPEYQHHVLPLSLSERRFACFNIILVVPRSLAESEIDATMRDGVLRIEMPRKPHKFKERCTEVKIA